MKKNIIIIILFIAMLFSFTAWYSLRSHTSHDIDEAQRQAYVDGYLAGEEETLRSTDHEYWESEGYTKGWNNALNLNDLYSEGYNKGYEDGKEDAEFDDSYEYFEDGYKEGRSAGYEEGLWADKWFFYFSIVGSVSAVSIIAFTIVSYTRGKKK